MKTEKLGYAEAFERLKGYFNLRGQQSSTIRDFFPSDLCHLLEWWQDVKKYCI